MKAKEIVELIMSGVIDPESEIFVKQGDQAIPATIKVLQSGHGRKNRTAYVVPDENQQAQSRDYSEGIAGTREVKQLGNKKKS